MIILIVIGPKDIGKTARMMGRFINRLYKSEEWKTITQVSKTLRTLPNRLAREAELEELQEVSRDFERIKTGLEEEAERLNNGMRAWALPASRKTEAMSHKEMDQESQAERKSASPNAEQDEDAS
jgi:hypothetical protein